MYLFFYGTVRNGFEECNIITRGIGRGGPWNLRLFWALKWHEQSECHLGPKKSRFSGPTPSNAPSNDVALLKTIKYKRHKNNCCCVLLLCVVMCCCVLLCVVVCCSVLEGWGGLLVGNQGVVAGWQGSPSPSHYSVGIHGCLLVGGGCYSYIRFDPSLAVFWLAHTTHSWDLTIAVMTAIALDSI